MFKLKQLIAMNCKVELILVELDKTNGIDISKNIRLYESNLYITKRDRELNSVVIYGY